MRVEFNDAIDTLAVIVDRGAYVGSQHYKFLHKLRGQLEQADNADELLTPGVILTRAIANINARKR